MKSSHSRLEREGFSADGLVAERPLLGELRDERDDGVDGGCPEREPEDDHDLESQAPCSRHAVILARRP